MFQDDVEMDTKSHTDSITLESELKQLWDKIRIATERISQLREQSDKYHDRVEHLEREVVRLQSELNRREKEIKQVKFDHSQLSNSLSGNNVLTPDEKEALKAKIKDFIAKINSHL